MDIDFDDTPEGLKQRIRSAKSKLNRQRSKGAKKEDRGKDEYKWLPKKRQNIADVHIDDEMPKHLYAGKRGQGKTQRR